MTDSSGDVCRTVDGSRRHLDEKILNINLLIWLVMQSRLIHHTVFIHPRQRRTGPPTEAGFSQGFFLEFGFLATVAFGSLSWGLKDSLIFRIIIDLTALTLSNENETWTDLSWIMTLLSSAELLYSWINFVSYYIFVELNGINLNWLELHWNNMYYIKRFRNLIHKTGLCGFIHWEWINPDLCLVDRILTESSFLHELSL